MIKLVASDIDGTLVQEGTTSIYPEFYEIIRKLKIGAGMIDVWVITEAANGEDQLDILSSAWLKQKAVRRKLPMIYGIAKGYEEAVDLVVQMAEETYRETGNGDILRYLKSRCSERQGRLM